MKNHQPVLPDSAALSPDRIRDIPISEIDDFPDHPFRVRDDEDMRQLVESIRLHGVMTPAVLRPKEDGRYELISGHRRKRACELIGLTTLRAVIEEMTPDRAVVYMVESNFQRSSMLPSEKAFAYKMRLDAMKRQGRRSDLTSSPPATRCDSGRSDTVLAAQVGESKDQIRRYIRLTHLVPELLALVDEGRIKMRPAVELSYLSKESQLAVREQIDLLQCTPSHDQAIRMRRIEEQHRLTHEQIEAIMAEEKPNQRERLTLSAERIGRLLPRDVTPAGTEDFICEAVAFYLKYGRGRNVRLPPDKNAR